MAKKINPLWIIGGIVLVIIMGQNFKFLGTIVNPPNDFTECNVVYRSNQLSWKSPGYTGVGIDSWVYYNGKSYNPDNALSCNLLQDDAQQIFGSIYYSPSEDIVIYKGIDTQYGDERCVFSVNSVIPDIVDTTCHISYDVRSMNFQHRVNKEYTDFVLCYNGGTIGECQPPGQSCNTPADTNCDNSVSNPELISYISSWVNNQKTNTQLLSGISAWVNS